MRRQLLLVAAFGLLPGCISTARAAKPFVLAESGQPRCAIVAGPQASEERLAVARELQGWLREITGATIPLGAADSPRSIVLGTAAEFPERAASERLSELGPEGFVVRTERDRLWLLANTELGLRHAAYGLLEELGCRWFFADPVWTVVPKTPTLVADVELRAKPAFDYRRVWYGWGPRTETLRKDYEAWLKHNRQLGQFQTDCGHAYERYIPNRLFKEHPDWFALVKGERKPAQLCTSNPEVVKRVTEGVLDAFRKDPKRTMASVEPNDGGGYCECERCVAEGSVSDRVFLLASRVAKGLRKEFPDKFVGLYAYAFHCDPPRDPLEPGVYVQVTTGFRYTKLSFEEQVTAFRKLGGRLGVYDYFSVYPWDWDMPGAAKGGRPYQLASDIRRYRDLGLSTYDAESSCNWGPNGLGYWMASKLMWNPELDPKELVTDFCQRAFEKGAEPMRRLYDRWASGERFAARGLKLTLQDLQDAYRREDAPAVRARLDRVAMYLHWLRLCVDYERAARSGQSEAVVERAHQLIVFSRRLMDTGLIQTFPMLFTEFFKPRFGALERAKGFDAKAVEAWKIERTDIPAAEEAARLFADDVQHFESMKAVEIARQTLSEKLVPLAERMPKAVTAWGDQARSPLCVESGIHCFLGKKDEPLKLTLTPFDGGHTIDGHWILRRVGEERPVAEGDAKAEKGKPAVLEAEIPADGVYALDPGTGFWKTAQLGFGPRPFSVWAGRSDEPGKPKRREFRLWLPRLGQPLYFFVPRGTAHFVIGFPSVGQSKTTLILRTADGQRIVEDKEVLQGDQASVAVPAGKDGAIWSLSLSSLRCVVELYGVPPYLARHPSELLVPEETSGAVSPR